MDNYIELLRKILSRNFRQVLLLFVIIGLLLLAYFHRELYEKLIHRFFDNEYNAWKESIQYDSLAESMTEAIRK